MKELKRIRSDASGHRADARAALRGNWAVAVIVALAANCLGVVGYRAVVGLEQGLSIRIYPPENVIRLLRDCLRLSVSAVTTVGAVMLVTGLLVNGVLALGSARYNRNLIEGREARLRDLFSGIRRFPDALGMHLLRLGLITLGLLLFCVPGVVLLCGLAMAPFALEEAPSCTGPESLRRSWQLMKGHKLELFWLELTFLGWELLSAFSFGVGTLFLNPYKAAARASFYRKLTAET